MVLRLDSKPRLIWSTTTLVETVTCFPIKLYHTTQIFYSLLNYSKPTFAFISTSNLFHTLWITFRSSYCNIWPAVAHLPAPCSEYSCFNSSSSLAQLYDFFMTGLETDGLMIKHISKLFLCWFCFVFDYYLVAGFTHNLRASFFGCHFEIMFFRSPVNHF